MEGQEVEKKISREDLIKEANINRGLASKSHKVPDTAFMYYELAIKGFVAAEDYTSAISMTKEFVDDRANYLGKQRNLDSGNWEYMHDGEKKEWDKRIRALEDREKGGTAEIKRAYVGMGFGE